MSELKKLDLNKKETPEVSPSSVPTPSITQPMDNKKIPLVILLIAIAGIASGFTLNKFFPNESAPASTLSPAASENISNVKVGDSFGVESDTFSDTAEGVLEKGGINGEGSHKLIRPGGDSQTVYLTSSVVDLDELVGHKVAVWGETFAAQKAGWLMDVGRVKVLELNAAPAE